MPSNTTKTQEHFPALPETPVGHALRWVLTNLNSGFSSVTEKELPNRLDSVFLKQVPPATFLAMSARLATEGPFTFERFDNPPTPTQSVAIVSNGAGQKSRLMLAVASQKPNLISGMLIQLAPDLNPPVATTWDQFEAGYLKLASDVNLYVAEIIGNDLRPIRAINSERRLAIGSAFKVYILGEIANQVQTGSASWEEELPVVEQWKSLPSGDMRNETAGKKYTLQHYAEKMISVSDNTATDHLLFRAGRENVEEFQQAMGHEKPDLNVPFLSTRDMFVLKLGPGKNAKDYIASDAQSRRSLLEGKVAKAKPNLEDASSWTKPRFIEDLEWFASAREMGRAMLKLKAMSESSSLGPIRKILSINPGLPFDRYLWNFIGYKGGSEPGVLNMTWLLQKFDDRWFVMSAGCNDQETLVDTPPMAGLMLAAATLLGQEKKAKTKRRR